MCKSNPVPFLPALFSILKIVNEKKKKAQMPEKATWSKYIFLLVFAVAYNIGVSCLSYMVQLVSGNSSFQNTSAIFYNSKFWLQIVGLSILVPIMEELLFRGIIYKRMRTKTPFLRAAMFSAIFVLVYALQCNTDGKCTCVGIGFSICL